MDFDTKKNYIENHKPRKEFASKLTGLLFRSANASLNLRVTTLLPLHLLVFVFSTTAQTPSGLNADTVKQKKYDTLDIKDFGGKKARIIYKTSTGRTLTLKEKDAFFEKYKDKLGQSFRFGDPVQVTLFAPDTPEDRKSYEELEAALRLDSDLKFNDLTTRWLNKPIGNIKLTDIDGKEYDFEKLKGRVVVLNFWFTTCGPCIKEIPDLNSIVKKYNNRNDLIFLSLALDSKEKIKEFLKKRSFEYRPIASIQATKDFGVYAWPTHMVVDKTGIIRLVEIGGDTLGHLQKCIDVWLQ